MVKPLSVLALGLQVASATKINYDGYGVYALVVEDPDGIEDALSDLDYLTLAGELDLGAVYIALAPDSKEAFDELGLNATLAIEDIGDMISKEGEMVPYDRCAEGELPAMSYFDSYHVLQDHYYFLEDLQKALPDNSELFDAGQSFEDRPIRGIHLWGSEGPGVNPAIIWHSTVHATEWITTPTVEYMTRQIISGHRDNDPLITETLDKFDIYVIPIANPDGFHYAYTTDRLWRKNRQTRDGDSCTGTDINRNWPFKWDTGGGSSTDSCSMHYRGEAAGDSTENMVLTNHTLGIAESTGIKAYIDWHSFQQLILLPYAYSCDAVVENLEEQTELSNGIAAAIKTVNGLDFTVGPLCETLYAASGGSLDWVKDVAGAEFSWAFELRPGPIPGGLADGAFFLPPWNILPSGKENWEGMKYLFKNL